MLNWQFTLMSSSYKISIMWIQPNFLKCSGFESVSLTFTINLILAVYYLITVLISEVPLQFQYVLRNNTTLNVV